jgi:hypothetical protein
MWGKSAQFDLNAMRHFLMVCRGVEPPPDEFRLGSWNHPTRPSPAALTYLKNGIEYYSEVRDEFRPFRDKVVGDYSSPATTRETFHSDFYRDLQILLEREIENLTSDTNGEDDHNG